MIFKGAFSSYSGYFACQELYEGPGGILVDGLPPASIAVKRRGGTDVVLNPKYISRGFKLTFENSLSPRSLSTDLRVKSSTRAPAVT
eukprot:6986428-Pyramimonas_sp.AAC.1